MVNSSRQDTVAPKKRRGPAPTGVGTSINVRFQPDQLMALDTWISKQDHHPSRPEAVRLILRQALRSE